MFRSFLDKHLSKAMIIAYGITIFTFGCGGGAFQAEPTFSAGYSIEQRVEDGKRIRATVQSDPCLVDIVFGLPEEQWRCYTPIPADADRLTPQKDVDRVTPKKLVETDTPQKDVESLTQQDDVESRTSQKDIESLTPHKDVPTALETSSGQTSDSNQINWNEAYGYIDEFVTVCGPVVSAYFATSTNGQPTFLNIGKEYPDPERFTALIWGRDLEYFPFNPDQYYFGKTICVQGFVEEYKGTLEIEVTDPEQIIIK
jgi:DNA/RNA endonuclease YhcR with UshA esterase domain